MFYSIGSVTIPSRYINGSYLFNHAPQMASKMQIIGIKTHNSFPQNLFQKIHSCFISLICLVSSVVKLSLSHLISMSVKIDLLVKLSIFDFLDFVSILFKILPFMRRSIKYFNYTRNFITSRKTAFNNKMILWAKQIKSSTQNKVCNYDKNNMFNFHTQTISWAKKQCQAMKGKN